LIKERSCDVVGYGVSQKPGRAKEVTLKGVSQKLRRERKSEGGDAQEVSQKLGRARQMTPKVYY